MRHRLSEGVRALGLRQRRRTADPVQADVLSQQLGESCSLRPEGPLLWVHLGPGADVAAVALLLTRLDEARGDLAVLVTLDAYPAPAEFAAALTQQLPADVTEAVEGFLSHWRPDVCLWIGEGWAPVLLTEASGRGVECIAADARMSEAHMRGRRWKAALARAELAPFRHILTGTRDDAARLTALGGDGARVETVGWLESSVAALPCNEAEWTGLSETLDARPVWLAADVPMAEIPAVIAAHRFASRLSHRLLLILVPADVATGPALRAQLESQGLRTMLRSADEEPEPDTQVYVADSVGEMGLWYRLAPVTYLGHTLDGGNGRSPMEPAALGSVVVHGPDTGAHGAVVERLHRAGGHMPVADATELGRAIERLLAPDKVADLAHRAWAELTSGAEAADRALELVGAALDRADALP
ncbi:3-deoxy-D-manno-octulosonic acid transferase [Oceaniovalibus sp. ACAM 378]|uniref:3-deoxy-D-manno-octulosonic acid transferase n=1 Tax=Oceaniovalibus sp. ACAM 378 TaxID=2599923 RepID=UPI001651BA65|nr:glycosyltransferase N-terminal domain-containing protein [Oceaniovalibus sp. ACAM 378]